MYKIYNIRNIHNNLLFLPLRPLLLRSLTKLPLRQLLKPPILPLNLANLEIILTPLVPSEHLGPPLNGVADHLPRNPILPLPPQLKLRLAKLLLAALAHQFPLRAHLFRSFLRVDRHVDFLDAAHVGREIRVEAPADKGARGISAGEEVVRAAGAVRVSAGRDVVDGAVEGEVDWLFGVGAVVGQELFIREVDWAALLFFAVG